MKKLSLIKVLGVFSVFYGSSVSFANPVSEVSQAMFSLIGNVNQQHVDTFEGKVQNFIEKLQNGLDTRNKKEKAEVAIAYFMDLIEIAKKVLQYQQNPNQQLRNELEAIARTYGGEVRELIWSVIPVPPAPVPPPVPPPVLAAPALAAPALAHVVKSQHKRKGKRIVMH